MKKIILFIAFMLVALCVSAQDPGAEPLKFTWQFILYIAAAVVAGIYEILVRLIPTIGNYSWIAKLIDILKWLSDFLNRKKVKK
jgi:hypothetical protein